MNAIKIILAESHPKFTSRLLMMLTSQRGLEVTAAINTGKDLLQVLDKQYCQILILDMDLPEIECVETIKLIKRKFSQIKILLLALELKTSVMMDAFQAGASGYLLKTSDSGEMKEALVTIAKGENYLGNHFATEIAQQYRTFFSKLPLNRQVIDAGTLSERETEVLTLIAQEYSNSEIADKLYISPSTVETHRKHLIKKLGVRNSLGLVKHALRNGLIDLN